MLNTRNINISFYHNNPMNTVRDLPVQVSSYDEADHMLVSCTGIAKVQHRTYYRYYDIMAVLKAAKHLSFKKELPELGLREYRGMDNPFVSDFKGAGAVHSDYSGSADIAGLCATNREFSQKYGATWAKLELRNKVLTCVPLTDVWSNGTVSATVDDLVRLYDAMDELLGGVYFVLALKEDSFGVGGRHENYVRAMLEQIELGSIALAETDEVKAAELWQDYFDAGKEHLVNGAQARAASVLYRQDHNLPATAGSLPIDDGARPAPQPEEGSWILQLSSGIDAAHPRPTFTEVTVTGPVTVRYTYIGGEHADRVVKAWDRGSLACHRTMKAVKQEIVS